MAPHFDNNTSSNTAAAAQPSQEYRPAVAGGITSISGVQAVHDAAPHLAGDAQLLPSQDGAGLPASRQAGGTGFLAASAPTSADVSNDELAHGPTPQNTPLIGATAMPPSGLTAESMQQQQPASSRLSNASTKPLTKEDDIKPVEAPKSVEAAEAKPAEAPKQNTAGQPKLTGVSADSTNLTGYKPQPPGSNPRKLKGGLVAAGATDAAKAGPQIPEKALGKAEKIEQKEAKDRGHIEHKAIKKLDKIHKKGAKKLRKLQRKHGVVAAAAVPVATKASTTKPVEKPVDQQQSVKEKPSIEKAQKEEPNAATSRPAEPGIAAAPIAAKKDAAQQQDKPVIAAFPLPAAAAPSNATSQTGSRTINGAGFTSTAVAGASATHGSDEDSMINQAALKGGAFKDFGDYTAPAADGPVSPASLQRTHEFHAGEPDEAIEAPHNEALQEIHRRRTERLGAGALKRRERGERTTYDDVPNMDSDAEDGEAAAPADAKRILSDAPALPGLEKAKPTHELGAWKGDALKHVGSGQHHASGDTARAAFRG